MQDINVFDDLRQLSLGQVKALEYGRYDINRYHFRTAKLDEDASGLAADYYGVRKKKSLSTCSVTPKS
jgi:hypothetical protein